MLRFLLGCALLPFAVFGVIVALATVVKIVDVVTHHPQIETHVKQKGH